MIHREDEGEVAVLRLEHGKANALDVELMAGIEARLDELERSPPAAVVLTGTGSLFSAGVDLYRVLGADPADLDRFLTALSSGLLRLFACPLPVVAAVNGHAIAGGCILAAACDHRVMADEGARIGVTELLVGVPFPAAALAILRALLPPHQLSALVYGGATLTGPEALARGLVDEVAPAADVLPRALEAARRLGSIPAATFALTKRQLRAPVLAACARDADAFDPEVRAVWDSGAARDAIRAFMEARVGKKKKAGG